MLTGVAVSDSPALNSTQPQTRRKSPRLRYLLSAILLLLALLQLFLYASERSSAIFDSQARIMARLLAQQSALAARPLLSDSDDSDAQVLVNDLAANPYIIDATLYRQDGTVFARSADALPLPQLLGFAGEEKALGQQRIAPYIGEIRDSSDEQTLGYLRVTLNHQALRDAMAQPQTQTLFLARLLLMMAIVLGFLLALALTRR